MTVCSSTKNNEEYTTSINIKNYQDDKSIKSVIIWSDANIDISKINYKNVESHGN